jgi:hypothetical protein
MELLYLVVVYTAAVTVGVTRASYLLMILTCIVLPISAIVYVNNSQRALHQGQ